MTLTALQLRYLTEEIQASLAGGEIRAIWGGPPRTLCLELRQGGPIWLLLDTRPETTRCHLLSQKPPKGELPAFAMQLRKWLEGAVLQGVEQLQQDRVLRFDFRRFPQERLALVAELTGRHANLFLLEEEHLLGSLFPDRSRERRLQPGDPYQLPPVAESPRSQQDPLQLGKLPPDGSRSRIVAAFYKEWLRQRERAGATQQIWRRLQRRQTVLFSRAAALEKSLKQAQGAEDFRRWGELLQSAYGQVRGGETQVEVVDYYKSDLPRIAIPLDPALDLAGNIACCFRRSRKYAAAVPRLQKQLATVWEQQEKLEQALGQAAGMDLEPLQALAAQLEEAGWLPPERETARPAAGSASAPYRQFISRSGKQILVGKGSRENDQLTFRLARGNDLWLHARDRHGSHVILRLNRLETIEQDSLLDAATLAAHYSQGKQETVLEVIYTYVKHVKKIKGGPPGKVTYANGRSLSVRIEAERLNRLLQKDSLPLP